MDAGVEQEGPGSCPKCGMALASRTVAGAEPDDPEYREMVRRLWGSIVFTVPLLAVFMGPIVPLLDRYLPPWMTTWGELVLASPVVLWSALNQGSEATRFGASQALRAMAAGAVPALPALVAALDDLSAMVRSGAAQALGSVGPQAGPALSALVAKLKDRDERVRQEAARAAGSIGTTSTAAINTLIEAMNDSVPGVRCQASETLAKGMASKGFVTNLHRHWEELGHKRITPFQRFSNGSATTVCWCVGPP